MASRVSILTRYRFLHHKTLNPIITRLISASPFHSQPPQLQETPLAKKPLPPNSSTANLFSQENWRNPSAGSVVLGVHSLFPVGFNDSSGRLMIFLQRQDLASLMFVFEDWMLSQRWSNLKQLFELWINSIDASWKPNMPNLNLYNHYLRANFMMGVPAGELLDLVAQMQVYKISPNTASYNLVLKAMHQARDYAAAAKLLDWMVQETDCMPDEESYNLVIDVLLLKNQIDSALSYLDMLLKAGYVLSSSAFMEYVRSCVITGKLDLLDSIIDKCGIVKLLSSLTRYSATWQYVFVLTVSSWASEFTHSRLNSLPMEARFEQWMTLHGRVYKDASEKAHRFRIFKAKAERVDSVNGAGNHKISPLGLNDFSDLTHEEFYAIMHPADRSHRSVPRAHRSVCVPK